MPSLNASAGTKISIGTGGSGSVSGTTTAATLQEITVFTTPASPVNAEYEIDLSIAEAAAGSMSHVIDAQELSGSFGNTSSGAASKKIIVGPNTPVTVLIAVGTTGLPYRIAYRYITRLYS